MSASTIEVTLGEVATGVAVPNGSPETATDRARAGTRARAIVASTQRDRKIPLAGVFGAVRTVAVDTATTVRDDLAGSWLWRNHLPSLGQLWARRIPARESIPGNCETPGSHALWLVETAWRTAAIVLLGVPVLAGFWLLHRAVTGVPTVLIGAALAAMWHINSGGGPR